MKHVFVETNFIIDVARPFPSPDAKDLLRRAMPGGDVELHLPWVSVVEAKRTLDRIIREDLGFTRAMSQFAIRDFLHGKLTAPEKKVLDALADRASDDRAASLQAVAASVDAVAQYASIIEPSKQVVTRVLGLYPVKSLPPFDEMVLGAVLTKADELFQAGERALWFCNLNKKDFDPGNQPALASEYARAGLHYRASFAVP